MAEQLLFYVLIFQGAYYLITAIWPVVSLRSFMRFAGPKPDRFVFWTVDLLIITIAITVLYGAIRGDLATTALLGILSAVSFITVELIFAGKISRWFFADLAVEVLILLGLLGTTIARTLGL